MAGLVITQLRNRSVLSQRALIFIIMLLINSPTYGNDWKTVHEAENLLVQSRPYEGSELNEIKGVTRLKASLNAAMALLKDASFNQQWVYRSGGAKVLEEVGYAQAYVYGIVDAPWPMLDRDTVVRFDYQQHPDTKTITIEITNFPDFIVGTGDYVRVPGFGGYWKLKPEHEGWVQVTYQVYGDPGGWIPTWLANQAAVLSVKNTLDNMQAAVEQYQDAYSEHVEELAPSPDNELDAAIKPSQ